MTETQELKYFEEILREVEQATGVKKRIAVDYQDAWDAFRLGFDPCNPAIKGGKTLVIGKGFHKCFDRNQLKAIIAHELGHVAHDDNGRSNWINPVIAEREADDFAAQHGFAADSIRALESIEPLDGGGSHPATVERIANFKRYLQAESK